MLKEYLTEHEQEVQGIMVSLFDNNQIVRAYAKEKIEKGREEERLEVAKKMLQESFSQDVVARISSLPLSEVNALKAQMTP